MCLGIIFGITFFGHDSTALDLSTVYKKQIDFWYVFTTNSRNLLSGALGGVATFGIVSGYQFFFNTVSLGIISNALISGGMPDMALRMLPHGLVELIALVIMAIYPLVLDVYTVRHIKPLISGNTSIGELIKNILVFSVVNLVVIESILFIAGIVEYVVSMF